MCTSKCMHVETYVCYTHVCTHVEKGLLPNIMALSTPSIVAVCINTSGQYNFTHRHLHTPTLPCPPSLHKKIKLRSCQRESLLPQLRIHTPYWPLQHNSLPTVWNHPDPSSRVTHCLGFPHLPESHARPWVKRPPDEWDFPLLHRWGSRSLSHWNTLVLCLCLCLCPLLWALRSSKILKVEN